MAKKKVYAVRKGKTTGIFYTWDACKAAVDGFSGAVYKGFFTEEEARAYLEGEAAFGNANAGSVGNLSLGDEMHENANASGAGELSSGDKMLGNINTGSAGDLELPQPGQIIAYVDGSFEVTLGRYAYGCVILKPDGEIVRESGSGNNPESAALRNVTGEMLGAMNAVKWCIQNGYNAVDIRYDYMGIEMWATGGWKAKNSLTQSYAEYMQRNAQRVKITFKKIAAHTGDKYNEEADKLAKAALLEAEE